ncbi:MAG: hypothetical protein K9G67_07320 [Bacteroidales bacterium]|nr:hypothetical protein [Bacteroidales bacterium]MCF8345472.1 hypothetical protein [Bacteroidales bacterium]MCF8350092.1 hypothetical protein [Bacteroidales bacterium]MCF8376150.1 hypothetical protein [Bacteroidales bacterium]
MGIYTSRETFNDENFQFLIEVDFQLFSFKEYIKLTEKIIDREIKEEIKKYNKFLKQTTGDQIEIGYDVVDHEIKIYTHQLYLNSIFISLYSFLEKKMSQLCKLAEKNTYMKVKDLSGNGIFKYYKYFKKVLEINLVPINDEWTLITKYNKLRNRIVHFPDNTIEKSENNANLIETFKSINNLSIIEEEDFYEFKISDSQLLNDFLTVIERFLYKIFYVRI